MKWEPRVTARLFLDDIDFKGILKYYYPIAKKLEAERKEYEALLKKKRRK